MKIWIVIFFVLPLLGCLYTAWHIWQMLPLTSLWKAAIITLMMMAFISMFVSFAVGLDGVPLGLARVIYQVSTSSIIVLLYLVIVYFSLDLLHFWRILPSSLLHNSAVGSLSVLAIMIAIFVYGNINYHKKVRVPIELHTSKPLAKPLKIVMLSDMHLGYHNTRKDLARWIDKINSEHPDVILIAGDIVDISVRPLEEEKMAEEFRRLTAPVYACLGNHDYYAREPKTQEFLDEANIHLLRDSNIVFRGVNIIGRDDRSNSKRKSVEQLVAATDKTLYTILVDHQPYNLEHAEAAGVDFQFSGHTHYGQVWPISWIEDHIYEDAYGPLTKGKTQYYVSSGIGIWGGKFRIGTQSEYVVAMLK